MLRAEVNTIGRKGRIRAGWRLLFPMLAVMFLSPGLAAQDLEVGATFGGGYYLGDLNPGKHFVHTKIAYGLVARLTLDTRWAVKLSGTRGTIKGDAGSSAFLPERGLAFTSDLTDISGVVEFNFRPYFTGSRMSAFSPYIYGGISVFFYDPRINGTSLREIGTEGQQIGYEGRSPYGSVGVGIPFGLGVKYSLGDRLGLHVYWEMHKTFNDYLDDVSKTYYLNGSMIAENDLAGMLSDPARNHQPGMQRGNESNKDWYAFFGASLTYKFNLLSKRKCRDLNH